MSPISANRTGIQHFPAAPQQALLVVVLGGL
jgi:hypothetical protein